MTAAMTTPAMTTPATTTPSADATPAKLHHPGAWFDGYADTQPEPPTPELLELFIRLADLHLDDHSIGSALEDMLITPLDQALSTHSPTRSGTLTTLTVTDVAREYGAWTVSLA